jgi:hypothetical protein
MSRTTTFQSPLDVPGWNGKRSYNPGSIAYFLQCSRYSRSWLTSNSTMLDHSNAGIPRRGCGVGFLDVYQAKTHPQVLRMARQLR